MLTGVYTERPAIVAIQVSDVSICAPDDALILRLAALGCHSTSISGLAFWT